MMGEIVVPLVLLIAVGMSLGLARALFFLVQVEGKSMSPTLTSGDLVLACRCRLTRWLCKGRLVVWQPPPGLPHSIVPELMRGELLIKRITGLPGDTVVTSSEPAFPDKPAEARVWQVPPNHYFVQGELLGLDSRIIGPIPIESIRGLVLIRLKRGSDVRTCP